MDKPLPWADLKVAFDVDDADAVWQAYDAGRLTLPPGWELNGTDGAGARWVAVFRVSCLPTAADGEVVRAALEEAPR